MGETRQAYYALGADWEGRWDGRSQVWLLRAASKGWSCVRTAVVKAEVGGSKCPRQAIPTATKAVRAVETAEKHPGRDLCSVTTAMTVKADWSTWLKERKKTPARSKIQ